MDLNLMGDATGMMNMGPMNPTASEYFTRQMQMSQMQQLAYMAAMQQGLPSANFAARLLTGTNIAGLSNGTQSQRNLGYALATGGGMLAAHGWLGGGSSWDAMQGVYQGLGTGGFRISGMSPGVSDRLVGGGGVTGGFAQDAYASFEDHFYRGLSPRMGRTHGLNRSDLGQVWEGLSNRGAFAGMNIGTLETMTSDSIMAGRMNAIDSGNTRLLEEFNKLKPGDIRRSISESDMDKVNKMVETAADSLASVRSLFGNQSMSVLMSEAERISGMSFSGTSNIRQIKSRVEGIQSLANAYGMDPRGMAEADFATSGLTATYMAQRLGNRPGDNFGMAAAATPILMSSALAISSDSKEAANIAAAQGRYLAPVDTRQILDYKAQVMAEGLTYESTMVASMYAAENLNLGEVANSSLRDLRQKLAATTDPNERQKIRQAMRQTVLNASGGRIDTTELTGKLGTSRMLNNITQQGKQELSGIIDTLDTTKTVTSFDSIREITGVNLSAAEGFDFMSKFDAKTRDEIIAALNGENAGESLKELINGKTAAGRVVGSEVERQAYIDKLLRLDREERKATGLGLGAALSQVQTLAQSDPTLMGLTNKQSAAAGAHRVMMSKLHAGIFGKTPANYGLDTLIAMAVEGGSVVDDDLLTAVMEGRSGSGGDFEGALARGKINSEGGGDFTRHQFMKILDMAKQSGIDLYGVLGVESPEDAVAKLSTPEGLAQLHSAATSAGMLFSLDRGGKGFKLASAASRSRADALAETMMQQKQELRMNQRGSLLLGQTEEEYAASVAAVRDGKKGSEAALAETEFVSSRLADRIGILSQLATDDQEDATGDAFMQTVEENPELWKSVLEKNENDRRVQAKVASKSESARLTAEADAIKTLRDKMDRATGNNYIGRLTIENALEIFGSAPMEKKPDLKVR